MKKNKDIYAKVVVNDETGKKEFPNGVSWSGKKRHGDNLKGIRTGNGLVVVDVDTKDFTKLTKKMRKVLESLKPTVTTARGYHYYFSYKNSKQFTNKANYSKHIDVRSDGGIIFNQYSGSDDRVSYESTGVVIKMPKDLEKQLFKDMSTSRKSVKNRDRWSEIESGAIHDGILNYMVKDKTEGKSYEEILNSATQYVNKYLKKEPREYNLMVERLDWVTNNIEKMKSDLNDDDDGGLDSEDVGTSNNHSIKEDDVDSRLEFYNSLKENQFEKGGYEDEVDKSLLKIINAKDAIQTNVNLKSYASSVGVAVTVVQETVDLVKSKVKAFEELYNKWLVDGQDAIDFAEESKTQDFRFRNLKQYEKNHALVHHGGKALIVSEVYDDNGNLSINLSPISTEKVIWSDRPCFSKLELATGEVETKELCTVDTFVFGASDEDGNIKPCHRYTGLEFEPKKKLKVAYNTFKGFKQKSVEGDISYFKKTMSKIYGKDAYELMMDWFADMYQNPQRKCTFALVVKGLKGTGKNTFESALGQNLLATENYFRTSSKRHLFGNFNSALLANLLIVGQEVVWGGNHEHDSALKEMITENTRVVEMKGIDSFTVNNLSRLYITSNAEWVIPATKDERRFYVVETNNGVMSKTDWKKFHKWLNKASTKEALMYEMLNRDISTFDNIGCPVTDQLASQKRESFYGVDAFMAEAIENGHFGREHRDSPVLVYDNNNSDGVIVKDEFSLSSLYNSFQYTPHFHNKISLNKFSRDLSKLGLEKVRKTKGVFFSIPCRETLNKKFHKSTGVKLNLLNL